MNVRRFLVRRSGCWIASLFLLPIAASAVDARESYDEGQRIQIKGVLTDAAGAAQPGRTVMIEAYRRAFDMRSLNPRSRGKKKGLVQRMTQTAGDGSYALEWPWHDYYNRFELSVGAFGADGFEAIERIDLSQRILQGSPVIVSFVLGTSGSAGVPERQPAAPVAAPSTGATPDASSSPSYADGGASGAGDREDQARVRSREGEPDLVDTLDLPYGSEVTWWYFSRGRAYRFLDGELSEEFLFDRVRSDAPSGGA